jgi:hypothetical protein
VGAGRVPAGPADRRHAIDYHDDDHGRTHYYGDGCDDDHGRCHDNDNDDDAAAAGGPVPR